LKAGLWFRRGRLFMVSPVRGDHRRFQAETPLIDLFKFAEPALGEAHDNRLCSVQASELQRQIISSAVDLGPQNLEIPDVFAPKPAQ